MPTVSHSDPSSPSPSPERRWYIIEETPTNKGNLRNSAPTRGRYTIGYQQKPSISHTTHTRLERAVGQYDNAYCLHLLRDIAFTDDRLRALFTKPSSHYDELVRHYANEHTHAQSMDKARIKGKFLFLLDWAVRDGKIDGWEERLVFALIEELHVRVAQASSF
jgi:hypothetical protein